jgi:hypothetical protein
MMFEIKNTEKYGRGLYTTKYFDKNQVILKFSGIKVLFEEIKDHTTVYAHNLLQIGAQLYLDVSGEHSYYINHSCSPNCIIKMAGNFPFLVAKRNIKSGEELTFDYSTTSNETPLTWQIDCKCGSVNCRKKISGFQLLAEEQQKKYLEIGAIPEYLK